MANQFWSFVFPPGPYAAECSLLTASGVRDHVPRPAAVVLEIFLDNNNPGRILWSVFFSVSALANPVELYGIFAVSNRSEECNSRAENGFQIVEGDITVVNGTLTVHTAFYPPRDPGKPSELKMGRLMTVTTGPSYPPLDSVASSLRSNVPFFNPPYKMLQCAPDLACPDSELKGQNLDVSPGRYNVQQVQQSGQLVLDNVLFPDLQTLLGNAAVSTDAWSGDWTGWNPSKPTQRPFRFPRRTVFGPPSFRFDDLEIVGFRTPLKATKPLVDSLNFHADGQDRNTPKDFLYRAASSTAVIELLRYGRMRGAEALPPFKADDFMPQHELLVRLVVGRVDDDTSQARDAALFVPAIFVDNPWSKAVGRQLQGFPKLLAEFRAGNDVLGMDGRKLLSPKEDPVPLHKVTEVHMAGLGPGAATEKLLTIDCPDADTGSADQFVAPDVGTFFANVAARRSPWEQFDFIQAEFRRSFARVILSERFGGFRVIQVSPVDDTPLPKAWIPGRYTLSNVQIAFPSGIATLRLENPALAPEPWTKLLNLLDTPDQLAFTTGDWYRVRCSMELEFDDGLEW
jgi:hypothetical protein